MFAIYGLCFIFCCFVINLIVNKRKDYLSAIIYNFLLFCLMIAWAYSFNNHDGGILNTSELIVFTPILLVNLIFGLSYVRALKKDTTK